MSYRRLLPVTMDDFTHEVRMWLVPFPGGAMWECTCGAGGYRTTPGDVEEDGQFHLDDLYWDAKHSAAS